MRKAAFIAVLALAGCGGDPSSRTLQGYAEADYLYLSPREAGFIETLAVKEGDAVEAGAPIFSLDVTRSDAALRRAQAAQSASGDTAAAQTAAVAAARADVALARTTYERTEALFKSGYVAQARLDQDKSSLDAAEARLRNAVAQGRAASSQTGASRADVAIARDQAGDRKVTAPVAGKIERIYLRPGELAQAGAPVVSLLAPSNMKLRFYAPEAMLALLQLGQTVNVACDNCAEGLTAKISYIATEPQFTPPVIYSKDQREKLVYLIEARPDQPEKFRPGLPVDVRLQPGTGGAAS